MFLEKNLPNDGLFPTMEYANEDKSQDIGFIWVAVVIE